MLLKVSLAVVVLSAVIGPSKPLVSLIPYCVEDDCYIRPENHGRIWGDAQQICKNYNATLPIVDNAEHQRSFVAAVKYFQLNITIFSIWLGANASDYGSNNWRWLDGSQYLGTGVQEAGPYTSSYIGPYTRSYAFLSKNEAKMNAYASEPSNNYSYICQYNTINAAICSNGTGRLAFLKGGRCYVKYDEKLSWFRARYNCTANNGDLASFSDLSLLDGIVDANGSWVGLRHSQWTWHNAVTGLSSDVKFTLWSTNEPNDLQPTCLSLDRLNYPGWRDRNCSFEAMYLCQVFSTTWTTSATPATPSVNPFASYATSPRDNATYSTTSPMTISSFNDTGSNCRSCSSNESQGNNKVFALGLGIGIPCAVIIIALIVTVIVQQRQLRKFGRSDEKFKSVVADSSEYSTPSPVVRSDEHDTNLHYLHLQNRNQLQDEQHYDQLRDSRYEQL